MEEVKKIYKLLSQKGGLRIRDIANDLRLDRSEVADYLFSPDNSKYWFQDDDSRWHINDGFFGEEKERNQKAQVSSGSQDNLYVDCKLSEADSISLQVYLRQVSGFEELPNDKIIRLLRKYKSGDEQAYKKIIEGSLFYVIKKALSYSGQGVPLEDLIQEGNIALMYVISIFQPHRSLDFYSYADFVIDRFVSDAVRMQACFVRIPQNQVSIYQKVQTFKERYEQQYGYEPASTDIDIDVDISDERLDYLNQLPSSLVEITEFHEDMDYLESRYTFAENFENNNYNHYYLNKLLSFLPRRSKEIVEAYYGLGDYRGRENTLETVGDKFGLTRERCRQVVEKARREMREQAKVVVRNPFRLELTPGINRFVPEPEFRVIAEKEKNQEISEIKESSPENAPEKKKRGRPLKIKNTTETKGQKNAAVNAARDKEPDVTTIVDGKYGIGISSNKSYIYDVATHKKLYESRGKIVYIRQHFYRLYYAYSSIVIHQIRVSPNNSFSTGDLVLYAGMKTQIHGRLNKTNYDKQVQDIKIDARTLDYLIKVNGDWYDSKGLQIKQ